MTCLPESAGGEKERIRWEDALPSGERSNTYASACGRFTIVQHMDPDWRECLVSTYELHGRYVPQRQTYRTFAAAAAAAKDYT